MKVFDVIRDLNSVSPFLWEVRTNGRTFHILCEDGICEDDATGTVLEDLTAEEAEYWIRKILKGDV